MRHVLSVMNGIQIRLIHFNFYELGGNMGEWRMLDQIPARMGPHPPVACRGVNLLLERIDRLQVQEVMS